MTRFVTMGETMGVGVTEVGRPLRTAGSMRLSIAGAESTVAIGLARLGHSVEWVGAVGDDELGARILRELAAEGVGRANARTDTTAPTGFMIRERATPTQTRVTYYRRDSAGSRLQASDAIAALDAGADILHISGITLLLGEASAEAVRQAVAHARMFGILVSFDVNHRKTLPLSNQAPELFSALLGEVDLLFVGHDELDVLGVGGTAEEAAAILLKMGPSEVVVKQGSGPAYAATATGSTASCQSHEVQVVDIVGAGDAFAAGYLGAVAEGLDLDERLRWGTTCAAYAISSEGDWEGLPGRATLQQGRPATETLR